MLKILHLSTDFFFGILFGGNDEPEYDLDAIAFLLDDNGKVANLGKTVKNTNGGEVSLYESDIVFFNSMKHPSGNIWLTGDNRTGAGDGDDGGTACECRRCFCGCRHHI